jgi:hypothetical protein
MVHVILRGNVYAILTMLVQAAHNVIPIIIITQHVRIVLQQQHVQLMAVVVLLVIVHVVVIGPLPIVAHV